MTLYSPTHSTVGGSYICLLVHCTCIKPVLIEELSSNLVQMFISAWPCAERLLPLCQLKVNVTLEGQGH